MLQSYNSYVVVILQVRKTETFDSGVKKRSVKNYHCVRNKVIFLGGNHQKYFTLRGGGLSATKKLLAKVVEKKGIQSGVGEWKKDSVTSLPLSW